MPTEILYSAVLIPLTMTRATFFQSAGTGFELISCFFQILGCIIESFVLLLIFDVGTYGYEFPADNCFQLSQAFGYAVCLFFFSSRDIFISSLISSLTRSSFSNESFNPNEFIHLLELYLLLILSFVDDGGNLCRGGHWDSQKPPSGHRSKCQWLVVKSGSAVQLPNDMHT